MQSYFHLSLQGRFRLKICQRIPVGSASMAEMGGESQNQTQVGLDLLSNFPQVVGTGASINIG